MASFHPGFSSPWHITTHHTKGQTSLTFMLGILGLSLDQRTRTLSLLYGDEMRIKAHLFFFSFFLRWNIYFFPAPGMVLYLYHTKYPGESWKKRDIGRLGNLFSLAKYAAHSLMQNSTKFRSRHSSSRTDFSERVFSCLLKDVVISEVLKYFALSCVIQMLGVGGSTHGLVEELKPARWRPAFEKSIREMTLVPVMQKWFASETHPVMLSFAFVVWLQARGSNCFRRHSLLFLSRTLCSLFPFAMFKWHFEAGSHKAWQLLC